MIDRNPTAARRFAEQWRALPGNVGVRLWLHALRRNETYTAEEVGDAVIGLSATHFWATRRELIVLIEERFGDVSDQLIDQLIERIREEGHHLYEDLEPLDPGRADWRPSARDQAMWLRLSAIQRAGRLPLRAQTSMSERRRSKWWDRLWDAAATAPNDAVSTGTDRFYEKVINDPGGKLAEILLQTIDRERKTAGHPTRASMKRLRRLADSESAAGRYARGACMRDIGFLSAVDEAFVVRRFLPLLMRDDPHGAELRSVVGDWAEFGAAATRLLKEPLLKGVEESRASEGRGQNVVAKILFPVVSRFLDPSVDWGIQASEVRTALRRTSESVRRCALQCLETWERQLEGGPAEAWRTAVGPAFSAVWPPDREFKHHMNSITLAALCVNAGDAFPEALSLVRPFIVPVEGQWTSVYPLGQGNAPEHFPQQVLELLWVLFGRSTSISTSMELGKIIQRIAAASPTLEVDRRFQWLEARASRF